MFTKDNGRVTDETIERVLEEEQHDRLRLAQLLMFTLWPHTKDKPKYQNIDLWQAVDSAELNQYAKAAADFLAAATTPPTGAER